jgi:hypothetical protein
MTYASTSVDRRAEYYARCASVIAADPLDFYTRAEKGRRFQAARLGMAMERSAQLRVVSKYLKSVSSLPAAAAADKPVRADNLLAFPKMAGAFH